MPFRVETCQGCTLPTPERLQYPPRLCSGSKPLEDGWMDECLHLVALDVLVHNLLTCFYLAIIIKCKTFISQSKWFEHISQKNKTKHRNKNKYSRKSTFKVFVLHYFLPPFPAGTILTLNNNQPDNNQLFVAVMCQSSWEIWDTAAKEVLTGLNVDARTLFHFYYYCLECIVWI